MEFPAVSHTRVEQWKDPQYTKSGMWWFTLLFGFFGLHHLLLRSPQTALIFVIANFLTFGYCWLYDLIQLSSGSEMTTDALNKFGMHHPFGALGLAQGMWYEGDPPEPSSAPSAPSAPNVPPAAQNNQPSPSAPLTATNTVSNAPSTAPNTTPPQTNEASASSASAPSAPAPPAATENNSTPNPTNPNQSGGGNSPPKQPIKQASVGTPSPWWFFFYALLLPIAPLAQFIAGDSNNGMSRFLMWTIVPLGWAFSYFATLYDYYIMLLKPADLFLYGSKRFFPFTKLGYDLEGHSHRVTGTVDIPPCPGDNWLKTLWWFFREAILPVARVAPQTAPAALAINQALATYNPEDTRKIIEGTGEIIEQGLETGEQVLDKSKNVLKATGNAIDVGVNTIGKVGKLGKLAANLTGTKLPSTVNVKGLMASQIPSAPSAPLPGIPGMPGIPSLPMMKGGGRAQEASTLDWLGAGAIGAVVGGGFLLAAGRKLFGNGEAERTDSPPNA